MATSLVKPPSAFRDIPGFEFEEGGNNVIEHHLVGHDKAQPWKGILEPHMANKPVMEVKGVGTKCYVDQIGRGGV